MLSSSGDRKIEELRARLASDPGSRIFFPLAEELRKAGSPDEAERVLRNGIELHPAYLSAWVSLGRVLSQQNRHREAVEALSRALTLDPENVVAARLAAESYLKLGEKVEAIKKFKLVHAFIPSDMEVQSSIESLERQLNPEKYIRPIRVTEEIPEFRDVSSERPEGEQPGAGSASLMPLAVEGPELGTAVGDPPHEPENGSARDFDDFLIPGREGDVIYDMGEVTEVSTWSSLIPDPVSDSIGEEAIRPEALPSPEEDPETPVLSIVPDFEDGRQKTIERLHRWLVLMQRSQHRND